MDANDLMKHTYTNFPYYAISSTTAEKILTPDQVNKIDTVRPASTEIPLHNRV